MSLKDLWKLLKKKKTPANVNYTFDETDRVNANITKTYNQQIKNLNSQIKAVTLKKTLQETSNQLEELTEDDETGNYEDDENPMSMFMSAIAPHIPLIIAKITGNKQLPAGEFDDSNSPMNIDNSYSSQPAGIFITAEQLEEINTQIKPKELLKIKAILSK